MGRIELDYLVRDVDRYGRLRFYVRRKGHKKIRLPDNPGTLEFMAAYQAAITRTSGRIASSKPGEAPEGSLRAACLAYYASGPFKQMGQRSQQTRRAILDGICKERGSQGNEYGPAPLAMMRARHITALRDAKAHTPEAANARVKALRQLFKFAIKAQLVEANPAREVDLLANNNPDGFRAWDPEDIRHFEAFYPVGTRARLALAILLYTAQRRSDVVRLGRQHVRETPDGPSLKFTQFKNRERKPVTLEIPLVPELQEIIDASPCGELTFLVTDRGRQFSAAAFGDWFRDRVCEAGLPGLSSHGLRKAAAARLAEAGRSEKEIMAVTGHSTSKEVVRYTRSAEQKRLANNALRNRRSP